MRQSYIRTAASKTGKEHPSHLLSSTSGPQCAHCKCSRAAVPVPPRRRMPPPAHPSSTKQASECCYRQWSAWQRVNAGAPGGGGTVARGRVAQRLRHALQRAAVTSESVKRLHWGAGAAAMQRRGRTLGVSLRPSLLTSSPMAPNSALTRPSTRSADIPNDYLCHQVTLRPGLRSLPGTAAKATAVPPFCGPHVPTFVCTYLARFATGSHAA